MHVPNAKKSAPRGRPRDPGTDVAILRAALKLLGEQGFDQISIDGVAAEAGVSKTTIYRRYRDKADLVSAAAAHVTDWGKAPDTGDIRQDLIQVMQKLMNFPKDAAMCMIGNMLVVTKHHPELMKLFRQRVVWPRRAQFAQVIERGKQQGVIRADVDIELTVDLLSGSYIARYLAGKRIDRDWLEKVVDGVWRGIASA